MADPILTKRQQAALDLVAGNRTLADTFYLTGGTALAEFFLKHRFSEDLDFFSERDFDISLPTMFLHQSKQSLRFESIDFQQSYNRNLFFLRYPDEVLKLEFTFYPFPRIDTSHRHEALSIVDFPHFFRH